MTQYLVVGIVVSLLFAEVTGISPGGVVVPAYFALYLDDPRRLLATVAVALLCIPAVRLIGSVTILYGRRRFGVTLLTGMVLKELLNRLYAETGWLPGALGTLSLAIGYLIPGLLARELERQGIPLTLLALAVTSAMTRLVCVML